MQSHRRRSRQRRRMKAHVGRQKHEILLLHRYELGHAARTPRAVELHLAAVARPPVKTRHAAPAKEHRIRRRRAADKSDILRLNDAPRELMPEDLRHIALRRAHLVDALDVGHADARRLDLKQHLVLRALGALHFLQTQITRPVQPQCLHPCHIPSISRRRTFSLSHVASSSDAILPAATSMMTSSSTASSSSKAQPLTARNTSIE